MLEYTFIFFRNVEAPSAVLSRSLSFSTDADAIREARSLLEAQQAEREPAISIVVARGDIDEAKWLGACDWESNVAVWRWAK